MGIPVPFEQIIQAQLTSYRLTFLDFQSYFRQLSKKKMSIFVCKEIPKPNKIAQLKNI